METELPKLPADLSTATPPDMDAHFAHHDDREHAIDVRLSSAINEAHRACGERPQYSGRLRIPRWPTTADQAITKAREVAAGTGRTADSARRAVDRYDEATCDLYEVRRDRAPLVAEWKRRDGWSRFFEVSAGHVHSSRHCKTCNRNGKLTRMGWHPELSGLTEADAVAALGPMLCTVCFPSAPLAWTVGREKPAGCEGAKAKPGTEKVVGWRSTRYADCTQCSARGVQVNDNGLLRRHKPVN